MPIYSSFCAALDAEVPPKSWQANEGCLVLKLPILPVQGRLKGFYNQSLGIGAGVLL